MNKKKVFIDFDGVLNTYEGWKGREELYKPTADAEEFLKIMSSNYEINIFTTREREKVYKWLIRYHLDGYIKDVTDKKEPAFLYIDDRVLTFGGDYRKTLEQIEKFSPHWQAK